MYGLNMSDNDKAALKKAQADINGKDTNASAAGHASQAEILRNNGIVVPTGNTGTNVVPGTPLPASWSGGGTSGGGKSYDKSAYLAQQHASRIEAELAGLKSAYDTSVQGYDAASEKLPAIYQQAKNQAAAQNAMEKRAFDERAAAGGLGSGTNAQAQLAMSSVYQAQLAAHDRELAQKQSDIQLEKAKLQAEYEAAISQARAEGNANLANALYQEMIRVQGLNREDEQIAAEWKREDALLDREEASAETELARKIALEYELIDPANIGQIKTLADLAALSSGTVAAAGGNPAGGNPTEGGNGYDNGGLTAAQVKLMQNYYKVTPDGLWGANSATAAGGLDASAAWDKFLREAPAATGKVYTASGKQVDPAVVAYFNELLEGGITPENLIRIVSGWVDTGYRGMTEDAADALLDTAKNWGRYTEG